MTTAARRLGAPPTRSRPTPTPHARPSLRLVRPEPAKTRNRARFRPSPLTILTSLCVTAVVFVVLLEQVVLAQSAFRLAEIRDELSEAQARHEELLLEAATLESPGRVESFARDHLGMVDPDPVGIGYIVASVPPRGGALAAVVGRGPLPATGAAAATGPTAEDAP